ncbi:hypothetical protein [Vibrio parahaemolyticus]|uniref:hypothetical protein n=1 Tax=Vibrio parahaemolyticus TaxID=670 RepID=UPI002553B5B1|nr:hypothetical protein [Vibrio parahaemolyticus]
MSQRNIGVPTEKGLVHVPASNHCDHTPYLAVTMCTFGQFEVTHVPSGYRLIGNFERAVNAFVSMFQFQLAINELGIDASGGNIAFLSEINEKDKQCEALGMTIKQWIGINTTIGNICSEFPWETDEEGPHAELEKLMTKLKIQ